MQAPRDVRTLIAVLRTPEMAAQVKAYCDANPDIACTIRLSPDATADAPGIVNGGADTVLIEAASSAEGEITALEKLCAYVAQGGSFIVIMEEPSAAIVRRLFRAGVTDVLPTPVMENELFAALATATGGRAAPPVAASRERRDGKIVAVLKSAGGVGATTAAINIGAALGGQGHGAVALVDLDVQFGQLALALDSTPRMNIIDAIRAGKRLDETLLASTLHAHASGLRILAAPPQITPLEAVTDAFIEQLYATLRALHGVSIIELPTAWALWMGDALSRADVIMTVVQPTVKSAAGAARIAQGLVDFDILKPSMFILASHYEKTLETQERIRKVGDIFRAKPAAALRYDPKTAAEAADRGVLFSDVSAKAPIVKDFEAAARKLAEQLGLEAAPASAPATFGRLLGSLPGRRA